VLNHDSSTTAAKIIDDLINIRLFREENSKWIEKAVITRIWVSTTSTLTDDALEQLQELFDIISGNSQAALSAPATHAAQIVSKPSGCS
jgi:hypothetical protein